MLRVPAIRNVNEATHCMHVPSLVVLWTSTQSMSVVSVSC